MKYLLLSIIFLLTTCPGVSFAQSPKVSFYFSAHPDDWQLFMGVNAFKDIAAASTGSSSKTVFIYTTAGEANCSNMGVNKPFYLARQEGAIRSIQFCSDIYSPHAAWKTSVVTITGTTAHSILQMTYKNIVCYFLRLPDGCFGQPPGTITKLANGSISTLAAVDSSATYEGYEDLVETMKNLADYESSTVQQPQVWMQASDWDPVINLYDHPDHVQTGSLATEVAGRLSYANIALFEGYNSCNDSSNLSPEETAMEAALQSQVSYGLTHNGWDSEWDPGNSCGHVSWTSRNYYRVYKTATAARAASGFLTISPNPAGNVINLTCMVSESGPVNIVLYDIAGNFKGTIVNENENTGIYTIHYDAGGLPQGNYIIYAKTPGQVTTLKLTKL